MKGSMGWLWMRGGIAALAASGLALACGGGSSHRSLPDPAPAAMLVADGLDGPEGLCFDSSGRLYVGSRSGRITRIDPNGQQSVFAETGRNLAGLAAGPQDEIFAAAFETGEVIAVSQQGVLRVAAFGLDGPNAIAFDAEERPLVSAFGLGGQPQIAVLEDDATWHTLTAAIPSPNGLAFGRDGRLYVADTFMNRVVRLEIDRFGEASDPEVYASGLPLPDGIAFDEEGNLFVAGGGLITVVTADPERAQRPYATEGVLDNPASLAFGFGEPAPASGLSTDGPIFPRDVLFFTNFGAPLGSGHSVASVFVGIDGLPLFAPRGSPQRPGN